MVKRAVGMAAVSVLLCGVVAMYASDNMPQQTGSAPEQTVVSELRPDIENIMYTSESSVGIPRAIGLTDTLIPAADYGRIFPYAAEIVGWDETGTAVYRYALADSAGELITNAVYTSVERKKCDENLIWIMYDCSEDGSEQISCAAQDGSWVLGPFEGSVTVEDAYIFVQREGSTVTIVYNSSGKIVGKVNGTVTSCSDDVIVSREGDQWFISDTAHASLLGSVTAQNVGSFSDGCATVQFAETQWGIIDRNGTVIRTTANWMDDCHAGYALVRNSENKYGIMDMTGDVVVAYQYVNGVHCSDTLPLYQLWSSAEECIVLSAPSKQKLSLPEDLNAQQLTALPDDRFAYINENGNSVIFDDLNDIELEGEAQFFHQGNSLVAVMENGYQLFNIKENKAGKLHAYQYVVPQNEAAYKDSVFTVTDTRNGMQGIADTRGKTVLEAKYDSIFSIDGSYFAAIQGSWSGIVDANGEWIVRTLLTGVN